MIYLYSGTPGSGKSLHTASVIFWRLNSKKPVIANFEIDTKKIKKNKEVPFVHISNDELTPEYLVAYSRKYFETHSFREGALLLVVDECQLIFNAREWNAKGRNEWLSFYTQHRKYGYDVILVAQFDRMIDRQIRSLIEYEIVHRKVSNFGIKGKIFSMFAVGKLFVAVKIWYPMKEKVGSEFFVAKKKYYSIYDTRNAFVSDEAGGKGSLASSDTNVVEKEEGKPILENVNLESLLDNTNT